MSTKKLQILGSFPEPEVYAAEESVDTSVEVINADTLGGRPASDFALAHDVENITPEDIGAAPAGNYATEAFVTNKIAEAQLSGGEGGVEIDLSGYVSKTDIIPITQGGTGNSNGYIRTGQLSGTTIGNNATAEGADTTAQGNNAHAEGYMTTAFGYNSHAEGNNAMAMGWSSHAEGGNTSASGDYSHSEGYLTNALEDCSHAEGSMTTADGEASHAEGYVTTAASDYQHVQGKYNIEDADNTYAHIVGNGDDETPSNAHTLDWDGNANFAGDVYVRNANENKAGKKLATEEYVGANSAPSGYGLGGTAISSNDLNNATNCGWYAFEKDSANTPFNYGMAMTLNRYGSRWTQIAFNPFMSGYGEISVRSNNGTEVLPWEYINPPMHPNTEYRTTERWDGKPVYVKRISFGALPAAGSSNVPTGISGAKLVNLTGTFYLSGGGAEAYPVMGGSGPKCLAWVNADCSLLYVQAIVDCSKHTGEFVIKYTKD